MAYKEPIDWQKVNDRVFIQAGQELELLATDDPNYVSHSRSFPRVFAKDKDVVKFIIEVNGNQKVVSTGVGKCGPTEVQPFYMKARVEPACDAAPEREIA